ncbi:MAG: succinate dehydrogenase cytochrome b subunit [Halothece sp. Uz-M2-17]|nr:succinate dehydrogenase cytochrome b subunit [Halothece sp. Uz-M2-17]
MTAVTSRKIPSLIKKYLMAITGLGMVIFVFGHLLGNLQIFLSPQDINEYAYFLHNILPREILWGLRIGLLVMIGVHIWMAIILKLENKAARPVGYVNNQWIQASRASRYMIHSGGVVLIYIIFHLLHFTIQTVHPEFRQLMYSLGNHLTQDVYAMMIYGFSSQFWYVSLFYIIGMGLLCWHLSHGASSLFQSLGLRNEHTRYWLNRFALVYSIVIFIGFASIPSFVLVAETTDIQLVQAKTVLTQIQDWDGKGTITIDYSDQ